MPLEAQPELTGEHVNGHGPAGVRLTTASGTRLVPAPTGVGSSPPAVFLAAIVVVYLLLALGYALSTPRWNNPDEPAHFSYIRHLARTGQFPVLVPGDWDSQRLSERLASGRFATNEPVDGFRYEGHQPPLYYLLVAPLLHLAERLGLSLNAQVLLLRCVSIAFGVLFLGVVYAAGRVLAPRQVELAPLAAGIVAFIPMHTAMSAAINNDTLAELLASSTLLAILLGLRSGFGRRGALAIGVLGGLLLLTKVTVYLFFPLALAALAIETARPLGPGKPRRWGHAVGAVGLALAVAGLLSGWWFARNLLVYGWPDLFGLIRHDQVVVGQARWPGLGENMESVRFLLYSTFRSFWAQFGWMAVVVDPEQERPYWLFLLLVVLACAGLTRFWRVELPTWPPPAVLGLRFLLVALGLVVVQLLVYNLSFVQAQGRYLYPAILPIGLLLALGWTAVITIEQGASRWRWLGFGLAFFWVWAISAEALSWLVFDQPAPLLVYLVPVVPVWLASKVEVRRSRASVAAAGSAALVVALVLMNTAALLRFVLPYFRGW